MTSNPVVSLMTLEEARQVLWVRPNRRPVGQLLDEGFLNEDRLKWAEANAYDARLRQAAQVILAHLRSPTPQARQVATSPMPSSFDAQVTLPQARATKWVYPPYRDVPMGLLLDQGQITLKDLGYAVENARTAQVRQAASTIILHRLHQVISEPPPSAGNITVMSSGRSYSQRWQMRNIYLYGIFIGALVVLLIEGFIASVSSILNRNPVEVEAASARLATIPLWAVVISLGIWIVLGILGVILGRVALDRISRRFEQQIDYHRRGEIGEERTVSIIQQVLDGKWSAFLNVNIPGRGRGDTDVILVGPAGVYALEVKNLTGTYRNVGEHWEFQSRKHWRIAKANPSRQAQANAVRLAAFLKADSISQWVTPAVVWANPDAPLTVENPAVAVWTLDRLRDELGNLAQLNNVDAPTRERIAEKLTKLCQSQAAKQWYVENNDNAITEHFKQYL